MRAYALLAVLLAVVPGRSSAEDETAAPPSDDPVAADAEERSPRLPRWGLAIDAGFPSFANASVMYRPFAPLRLYAGPAWNYFAWGLQGGVALVPWRWVLSPVLSLEAGKFRRSNLGSLVDDGDEDAAKLKPLLARVDYSYAALDLGVEIGSQRGFAFSLKFGLSWIALGTNGRATYAGDGGTTVSMRDPAFRGTLGSAKLGLHYWF